MPQACLGKASTEFPHVLLLKKKCPFLPLWRTSAAAYAAPCGPTCYKSTTSTVQLWPWEMSVCLWKSDILRWAALQVPGSDVVLPLEPVARSP